MKFVILPCFLLLFSSINIFAQHDDNLVFNGDFELLKSDSLIHDYLKTKEFDTQIDGWETPSYGSSDILSADFSYNHVSLQPKNGKYAIGIAVNVSYSKKEKKISRYFEYAQCKLKTPLKANKKYLMQFAG